MLNISFVKLGIWDWFCHCIFKIRNNVVGSLALHIVSKVVKADSSSGLHKRVVPDFGPDRTLKFWTVSRPYIKLNGTTIVGEI